MIGDAVFDHLRHVTEIPDFSRTQYEVLDEIGRGGMGVVYRARDTRLDRMVALKVIEAGPVEEPRTMASLEHAGLVPVYDCGVLEDGRTYYAMRLIAGQRLDEYVRMEPPLQARLRIFEKICDAVAFAHDRGIIHCDLKPHNIMAGSFGEVFVMDWGVANLPHAGTPRYRAPDAAPTPRTDVFSLGRILDDLGPLPRPLAAVAARASSEDPAARYGSVKELALEVTRFLDGLPVAAYREGPVEAVIRFARRNHVLLLLLATYLVVKFALLLIFRR